VRAAGETVAAIIAAGIIPAALEFMDRRCIAAVEAFCAPGYPPRGRSDPDREVDGIRDRKSRRDAVIAEIARELARNDSCMIARARRRARAWSGRRPRSAPWGGLRPDLLCMDGTIPQGVRSPSAGAHSRSCRSHTARLLQRVSTRATAICIR
jgi:glycolate oxidase